MDISKGFQIEQPKIFVPWKISETELKRLFDGQRLCHVTHGYFTTTCTSLNGLSHELGFHFYPLGEGVLIEFEFFRRSYPDQAASFQEFQRHLEMIFGQPTTTTPGTEGLPSHTWQLQGAQVIHFVYDRFGPEEHVRIKKLPLQMKIRLFIKPYCGWCHKAMRWLARRLQSERLSATR